MIIDALLLAWRDRRRNMMRASLTTLGVIIGVAAVIAMVTVGNGATVSVTSSIGSLGRNLLILAPGTRRVGGANAGAEPFAPGDVEAVRRDITGLRAVAPVAQRAEIVVAGNQNHSTQVTGTDNSYFDVRDCPPIPARASTEAELRP